MTIWKSTLNQPLRDQDAARIVEAWDNLRYLAGSIENFHLPDPVDMLNRASDMRMAAWEVTRAIDEAFFQANKRIALARPEPKPSSTPLNDLKDLGL